MSIAHSIYTLSTCYYEFDCLTPLTRSAQLSFFCVCSSGLRSVCPYMDSSSVSRPSTPLPTVGSTLLGALRGNSLIDVFRHVRRTDGQSDNVRFCPYPFGGFL